MDLFVNDLVKICAFIEKEKHNQPARNKNNKINHLYKAPFVAAIEFCPVYMKNI